MWKTQFKYKKSFSYSSGYKAVGSSEMLWILHSWGFSKPD